MESQGNNAKDSKEQTTASSASTNSSSNSSHRHQQIQQQVVVAAAAVAHQQQQNLVIIENMYELEVIFRIVQVFLYWFVTIGREVIMMLTRIAKFLPIFVLLFINIDIFSKVGNLRRHILKMDTRPHSRINLHGCHFTLSLFQF